jgi:multidrug resistance efflux pump
MGIRVEIAPGELIDKITILEIKIENIQDEDKLTNVRREYEMLRDVLQKEVVQSEELSRLTAALKEVNAELWRIEDDIRAQERAETFGAEFVALARSVYRTNDRRAALKREINELLRSVLIEEKSYTTY